MSPARPAVPDDPLALENDPWARAAAWMWVAVPRRVASRLRILRGVLGDGHFLATFPVVAVFLPVASLAAGLWVGARAWGYELVLTESVFLLSALALLGAFSGQLAVLALGGFAAGDFFVRFRSWSYGAVTADIGALLGDSPPAAAAETGRGLLDRGIVAGLWRVRLPLVIFYLVLGIGAVVVPRVARGLAATVLRSARLPASLDWLVGSTAYVLALWLALAGWGASLPLLIRPLFAWQAGLVANFPPAQATYPIQNFLRVVVAAGVVGAIARQLVVLAVNYSPGATARVRTVVSLAQPLVPPPWRATRRGGFLRAVGAGVVATLMIAGLLDRVWAWALAATAFVVVALLRAGLAPKPAQALWRGIERVPLVVRIVGVVVLVRLLAGAMASSVIRSFAGLSAFVVASAVVSALLLPPKRAEGEGLVAASQAGP